MKKLISLLVVATMLLSLVPVSMIGVSAETDSQGVKYALSEDGTYYTVWGYSGSGTEIVIAAEIDGLPVKAIDNYVFLRCYDLTSVEFPNSITTIGYSAFYDCTGLKSINIPASVTNIIETAFVGCTNLESITVASENTTYKSVDNCLIEIETKTLLYGCKNSIIPSDGSVTTIAQGAFFGCTGLTNIEIPDSVTIISEKAFGNCTNLQYNEYNNGIYLGNSNNPYILLVDITSDDITSFTIHEETKIIGCGAFSMCTKLTSIDLPDSITCIGDSAFTCCNNLTDIELPDSLIYIGEYAFYCCTNLTSVVIPDSVEKVEGWAFAGCPGLTSVVIGSSVIGKYAFNCCPVLTSVVITDSVTTIEEGAFEGCGELTSIEVPDSVENIEKSAFSFCTALTDIYCEAESQPEGWDTEWKKDCDATVHWGSKAPETEKPIFGNIDGDNDVDSLDYLFVKRTVLNTYTLTAEQKSAADIDKDGDVDSLDYLFVKRMVLGTYTVK